MATILIVDDEEPIRKLIGKSLTRVGYDILEAENGFKALTVLRENEVNLIIIDLIMPEKGGIETLIDIHEQFPSLKRIAISGKVGTSNDSIQEIIEQFKVDAMFSKPFDVFDLLKEIKTMVPLNDEPIVTSENARNDG